MEMREKMNLFYESAIEVANQQSVEIMREHTATMERLFAEYKKHKQDEIEMRYQIEERKLKREQNRRISEAQTEHKRLLSQHQQEKREALFAVVSRKLSEFRESGEYQHYLEIKIKQAKCFAAESEAEIYLSRQDADKKQALEEKTGCSLLVSEQDFGGGIRAVIRRRNVLIDESFETKLEQEKDAYTF